MSNNEVKTLVIELQQGNEAAFSKLYDKYSPALYGIILKIVRDDDGELLRSIFYENVRWRDKERKLQAKRRANPLPRQRLT